MHITAIKRQLKDTERYSIFLDGEYAFSLSAQALLDSRLSPGGEVSQNQLAGFKKLDSEDKLYNQALRYAALRTRTVWEITRYLERYQVTPLLIEQITNKLVGLGFVSDLKYAQAYVNDRQRLRPTSRRKIISELQQKHLSDDVIREVVSHETEDEQASLVAVINRKRQQLRYQDELKLMQYLARQGFAYGDIKAALKEVKDNG
jgi:regulatory protein